MCHMSFHTVVMNYETQIFVRILYKWVHLLVGVRDTEHLRFAVKHEQTDVFLSLHLLCVFLHVELNPFSEFNEV